MGHFILDLANSVPSQNAQCKKLRHADLGSGIVKREMAIVLRGKRVLLRPLKDSDFEPWNAVRVKSGSWLTDWEPLPPEGWGDPAGKRLFMSRCIAREQESRNGSAHSFGVFYQGRFVGEANLSGIQRGPIQTATIGYWINHEEAGNGLIPEACATIFRFAFEDLGLHRIQISIVPRNAASLRVVEKLGLREEGLALRYIEINGVWEDHRLFAITFEEWKDKRGFYTDTYLMGSL